MLQARRSVTADRVHPFRRVVATGAEPVPVYLVTGFLGSGKTTLLRQFMRDPRAADTALIINEFGEIGLDHLLVDVAIENTLLLENGCVCCSIRGDLVDTIGDLLTKAENGTVPPFARIVVETTGLADPRPIVLDLSGAHGLRGRARLSKIVVTIDAALGRTQLQEHEEAVSQVAQADLCLITKRDLVSPRVASELMRAVRDINPLVAIDHATHGMFALERFLALPSDEYGVAARDSGFHCEPVEFCPHDPADACTCAPSARATRTTTHAAPRSWTASLDQPLLWPPLRAWLDMVYSLRASDILRMKAVLDLVDHEHPVILHGVGALVGHPETRASWDGLPRRSQIVLITRNLDTRAIEASFRAMVGV